MLHACLLDDLAPGTAVRLDLRPPVTVFRTEVGEVFAVDDTCTHQDASLRDGWLEGATVECPVHEARFDLRTGAAETRPARLPLRTHHVVIHDGAVLVELSEQAPAARPLRRHVPLAS